MRLLKICVRNAQTIRSLSLTCVSIMGYSTSILNSIWHNEYESLMKDDVWNLVELPKGKKVI